MICVAQLFRLLLILCAMTFTVGCDEPPTGGDNQMYLDDMEIFSDSPSGEPATGSLADGNIETI